MTHKKVSYGLLNGIVKYYMGLQNKPWKYSLKKLVNAKVDSFQIAAIGQK